VGSRPARDYVYALTDYREVDRTIALAPADQRRLLLARDSFTLDGRDLP
jgi:hypothetical protein